MNSSDVALITPIDVAKVITDANGNKASRFYDKEALRCFSSWRKNAGELKDISIYALSFNPKEVYPEEFNRALSDMNVKVFYDTRSHTSGFKNEVMAGLFFERCNEVKEDIMIKIDLDMKILKPIDNFLIDKAYDEVIVGQYDEHNAKDQRQLADGSLPFDTSFIVSSKKMKFYELYMSTFNDSSIILSDEWKAMKMKYGDYFKIEYAVDVINKKNLMPIHPVQYYQFGEGYRSIKHFTDEQVKSIVFLHEHIYENNMFPAEYDAKEEHIQYIKRRSR